MGDRPPRRGLRRCALVLLIVCSACRGVESFQHGLLSMRKNVLGAAQNKGTLSLPQAALECSRKAAGCGRPAQCTLRSGQPRSAGVQRMAETAADARSAPGGAGMIFPIFVGAAIVNRVLYRIQLVPMRDYTYFISQFSCCCYVLIYGAILVSRIRSGAVTPQMLEYAKDNAMVFACIGIMEAVTFLLALYSAARLPGGLIGVLGQGALLFSVILSRLFLGTRLDGLQKMGVVVVICGVLSCTFPQAAASGALSAVSLSFWNNVGLYSVAMGLTSGAVILKQKALQEADLDVIVVSAFGSAAQFVATLLLLPATLSLATTLPAQQYLALGWKAFMGAFHGGNAAMPWLTMAYMCANLTLNLSAIALVKRGGAVATMVAGTLLVPVYGLVFCFNLPLLGAAPFSWDFVYGLLIVTVGSFLYNHAKISPLVATFARKVRPGNKGND